MKRFWDWYYTHVPRTLETFIIIVLAGGCYWLVLEGPLS